MDMLLLFFLLDKIGLALGGEREEKIGLEQRVADAVELDLQVVQVSVQPALKNLLHRAELQFGREPAGVALGVVDEPALGHAGNLSQRRVELRRAETDRARKILAQAPGIPSPAGVNVRPVEGFVGVPGAARAQDRRPLQRLGLADRPGNPLAGRL